MSKSSPPNREGFWRPIVGGASLLPGPIPNEKPWRGKSLFLKALEAAESESSELAYRGWSTCRLCGEHNGSKEHTLTRSGRDWIWPSGYYHYIKVHNVRPSLAFQEFILGETIKY